MGVDIETKERNKRRNASCHEQEKKRRRWLLLLCLVIMMTGKRVSFSLSSKKYKKDKRFPGADTLVLSSCFTCLLLGPIHSHTHTAYYLLFLKQSVQMIWRWRQDLVSSLIFFSSSSSPPPAPLSFIFLWVCDRHGRMSCMRDSCLVLPVLLREIIVITFHWSFTLLLAIHCLLILCRFSSGSILEW